MPNPHFEANLLVAERNLNPSCCPTKTGTIYDLALGSHIKVLTVTGGPVHLGVNLMMVVVKFRGGQSSQPATHREVAISELPTIEMFY